MSPAALGDVRAELARFTRKQAIEFAELALSANSAVEARAAVFAAATPITTPTESEKLK
jgi:phosphotransferase system enzyme I (PtsI)